MEIKNAYETIVIGGGAAGLFFGAAAPAGRDILILEKTKQTGTKLLMSGSGQCNLTHGGSDVYKRQIMHSLPRDAELLRDLRKRIVLLMVERLSLIHI